jgi:amidase
MATFDSESNKTEINRRSVLGLATGAAIGAATTSISQPAAASIPRSDIVMMDAVALASAIHTRQHSCVEVMTAYLDHIDRLNPKVNAIVALEDRADR